MIRPRRNKFPMGRSLVFTIHTAGMVPGPWRESTTIRRSSDATELILRYNDLEPHTLSGDSCFRDSHPGKTQKFADNEKGHPGTFTIFRLEDPQFPVGRDSRPVILVDDCKGLLRYFRADADR